MQHDKEMLAYSTSLNANAMHSLAGMYRMYKKTLMNSEMEQQRRDRKL